MKRTAMLVVASLGLSTAVALAQSPNDAQIASIVVTANQVDIDAGQAGQDRRRRTRRSRSSRS